MSASLIGSAPSASNAEPGAFVFSAPLPSFFKEGAKFSPALCLAALVSSSAFVNALFLPLLLLSVKRVSSALVVMASASSVLPNCEAKKLTLLSLFFTLKSLKSLSLLPCFFTLTSITCEEFICAKTLSPDNNVSCVSSLNEAVGFLLLASCLSSVGNKEPAWLGASELAGNTKGLSASCSWLKKASPDSLPAGKLLSLNAKKESFSAVANIEISFIAIIHLHSTAASCHRTLPKLITTYQ